MKNLIYLLILFHSAAWAFSLEDFEKTRSLFLSVYSPIVKEQTGLILEIKYDYEAKDYFGGMSVENDQMQILLGSELDQSKSMTPDFYAFILCHEVGHLLGGFPKKISNGRASLYSSEGQSDYYAASTCLKKLFSLQTDPSTEIKLTDKVNELCKKSYNLEKDIFICQRIANSGREFFEYLKTMYKDFYQIDFPSPNMDTPENSGQSSNSEYPSFQCRLDTIIAGATGSKRPSCWYPNSIQN